MTMLCSWWFSSVGVSRRLKYFGGRGMRRSASRGGGGRGGLC
jgi:hypothetical protein